MRVSRWLRRVGIFRNGSLDPFQFAGRHTLNELTAIKKCNGKQHRIPYLRKQPGPEISQHTHIKKTTIPACNK